MTVISEHIIPEDLSDVNQKIEKLYETYHKLMFVIAYNILNHEQDAEDVVIASWEKIIRHIDKIKEIQSQETKSFIVIIVERTAIDLYRKNKKHYHAEFSPDALEQSPYFSSVEPEFEQTELYSLLQGLPKIYGEVLILYYVNELTGKEIGKLLQISRATVMKRLERARKYLKKEITNI